MSIDGLIEKYKTNLWAEFCMETTYKDRLRVLQKYKPARLLKQLKDDYKQGPSQAEDYTLSYMDFWNCYLEKVIEDKKEEKNYRK